MIAPAAPPHILVLNGDPAVLGLLRAALEDAAYRVATATCAADSPTLVTALQPDLVLLDLAPGQPDGWALLDALRRPGVPRPPVVVLSTQPCYLARVWERVARYGRCAVLAMPFDLDDLDALVARTLAA